MAAGTCHYRVLLDRDFHRGYSSSSAQLLSAVHGSLFASLDSGSLPSLRVLAESPTCIDCSAVRPVETPHRELARHCCVVIVGGIVPPPTGRVASHPWGQLDYEHVICVVVEQSGAFDDGSRRVSIVFVPRKHRTVSESGWQQTVAIKYNSLLTNASRERSPIRITEVPLPDSFVLRQLQQGLEVTGAEFALWADATAAVTADLSLASAAAAGATRLILQPSQAARASAASSPEGATGVHCGSSQPPSPIFQQHCLPPSTPRLIRAAVRLPFRTHSGLEVSHAAHVPAATATATGAPRPALALPVGHPSPHSGSGSGVFMDAAGTEAASSTGSACWRWCWWWRWWWWG
jgi:hypothetical protein